jgi:hypothetical protein
MCNCLSWRGLQCWELRSVVVVVCVLGAAEAGRRANWGRWRSEVGEEPERDSGLSSLVPEKERIALGFANPG